ncbi:hypothetical protein HDU97_000031 [Phlyctochytrium planicorne]|nr:hypothetical protein HDU97_000031 [Phlyctochytrium planicorne]
MEHPEDKKPLESSAVDDDLLVLSLASDSPDVVKDVVSRTLERHASLKASLNKEKGKGKARASDTFNLSSVEIEVAALPKPPSVSESGSGSSETQPESCMQGSSASGQEVTDPELQEKEKEEVSDVLAVDVKQEAADVRAPVTMASASSSASARLGPTDTTVPSTSSSTAFSSSTQQPQTPPTPTIIVAAVPSSDHGLGPVMEVDSQSSAPPSYDSIFSNSSTSTTTTTIITSSTPTQSTANAPLPSPQPSPRIGTSLTLPQSSSRTLSPSRSTTRRTPSPSGRSTHSRSGSQSAPRGLWELPEAPVPSSGELWEIPTPPSERVAAEMEAHWNNPATKEAEARLERAFAAERAAREEAEAANGGGGSESGPKRMVLFGEEKLGLVFDNQLHPVYDRDEIEDLREEEDQDGSPEETAVASGLQDFLELYWMASRKAMELYPSIAEAKLQLSKVVKITNSLDELSKNVKDLQNKRIKDSHDVNDMQGLTLRSLRARFTGRIRQAKMDELTELETTTDMLVNMSLDHGKMQEDLAAEELRLVELNDRTSELQKWRKEVLQYLNMAFESVFNETDEQLQAEVDRLKSAIQQHDSHIKQIVACRQILHAASSHLSNAYLLLKKFVDAKLKTFQIQKSLPLNAGWPYGVNSQLSCARALLVEMKFALAEVPVPAGTDKVDVMMDKILSHLMLPTLCSPPGPPQTFIGNTEMNSIVSCYQICTTLLTKADAALKWLKASVAHIARVRDGFIPKLGEARRTLGLHRILEFEVCGAEFYGSLESEAMMFKDDPETTDENQALWIDTDAKCSDTTAMMSPDPMTPVARRQDSVTSSLHSSPSTLGRVVVDPVAEAAAASRLNAMRHRHPSLMKNVPSVNATLSRQPIESNRRTIRTIPERNDTVSSNGSSNSSTSTATRGSSSTAVPPAVPAKEDLDPTVVLLPENGVIGDVAIGGSIEIFAIPEKFLSAESKEGEGMDADEFKFIVV